MSKYEKLWEYLQKDNRASVTLSFQEIQDILGFEIDHSFLSYKIEAFEYGYQVGKISMKEKHVDFLKRKK